MSRIFVSTLHYGILLCVLSKIVLHFLFIKIVYCIYVMTRFKTVALKSESKLLFLFSQ